MKSRNSKRIMNHRKWVFPPKKKINSFLSTNRSLSLFHFYLFFYSADRLAVKEPSLSSPALSSKSNNYYFLCSFPCLFQQKMHRTNQFKVSHSFRWCLVMNLDYLGYPHISTENPTHDDKELTSSQKKEIEMVLNDSGIFETPPVSPCIFLWICNGNRYF